MYTVAQFVEALSYKPEGSRFDSRWCNWNFSLTKSLRPHCCPGVDSASNRNEHQEHFLWGKGTECLRLTMLPPLRADCLEIWETETPGNPWTCNRPEQGLLDLCLRRMSYFEVLIKENLRTQQNTWNGSSEGIILCVHTEFK